jgi:alkyl sulfatase BDS1-like metallo-beta-lactamase superfamily hydrolase
MDGEIEFLSDEWLAAVLDAYRDLPPRPGATGVVEHTVTAAPAGDTTYWVAVEDGQLTGTGAGPRPDATVTVTVPYATAADLAAARLDLSSAFMQGRAKVAGDHAGLLRLLSAMARPEHRAATERLAARTRV